MINPETEIRKLRPAELYSLAATLSPDSWKLLMGIIPKDESQNLPMFTKEHINIIEATGLKQHRLAAEIFLDEWSTMGRKRPTIRTVIDLLVKIELFRAADYLAVDILKEAPPKRPRSGPAAPINIFMDFQDVSDQQNLVYQANGLHNIPKENYAAHVINNDNLQHVYEEEKFHAEEVSKFPFNSKSDLIKFSTNILSEDKNNCDINYGVEQEEFVLPNFKELNMNSNQDGVSRQREVKSEKLSTNMKSDVSTCEAPSSQSTVDSKDSMLMSDNLPVILKEINKQELGDNLRETNHNSIDRSSLDDSYQHLPLPILELCKR